MVVDILVVAQRPFLLVPCSRQLRFPSCSPLTRCSMSFLCKSSRFSGAGREKMVEIPQLHSSHSCLDKVVHTPVVCNDRCPDGSDAGKLCRSRSCSTFEPVVFAPVMQVQFLWLWTLPVTMQRRCSLESGSASESVHRLVWWTSQLVGTTTTTRRRFHPSVAFLCCVAFV